MPVLLLLIAWTLVEIALFVTLGGALGLGLTLVWVLATGVLGVALIRRQGMRVGLSLQRDIVAASDPASAVAHGALIIIAALLLILPGFLSDAAGLALLVPAVRRLVIGRVVARVEVRRQQQGFEVIDGEVVAEEQPPRPAVTTKPSGWTKV